MSKGVGLALTIRWAPGGKTSLADITYLDPGDLADADHRRVIDYWVGLKGEAFAPSWADWDWMRLPMKLIPYFVVADVLREPLDFRYRFYGSGHVAIYGRDYTGCLISEIQPANIATASLRQYAEVLEKRKPIVCLHTVDIEGVRVARDQVSIRMPMSSNGTDIDIIASFADYRRAQEDMKEAFSRAREAG